MAKPKVLPVLISLLAVVGLMLNVARPALAADPAPTSRIDAFVQEQMIRARIPGVALAIVRDHQVTYTKGYGEAGAGRPVTPDTPFTLGSTSKSFTAMAVMQLAEAGKLDLNAPVQRYLPWFTLADSEASARVTVRHLLNHTSGISTRASFEIPMDAETPREEVVRRLKTVTPTAQPGALFQYSNVNYATLGLIVEAVSGQPFEQYVQAHILDPIGMVHSYTAQSAAAQNGLADGHQYLFGFPVARSFPQNRSMIPAGYVISSASDMGRYLLTVMDDGQIGGVSVLSPAGVAEMQRPQAEMGPDHFYAMGWERGVMSGIPVISHRGDVENFQSYMVIAADKRFGVVLLANSANALAPDFQQLVEGVVGLMAGQEPTVAAGMPFSTVMQLVDVLLAVVILWQVWSLIRLTKWNHKACRRSAAWKYVRVACNLLVGVALWAGIPVVFPLSWSTLWVFVPDLSYMLAAIATLSLLVGAGRLLLTVRRGKGKAPAAEARSAI